MSIKRAAHELQDWLARHHIDVNDIEIVFRGEAAYAVEAAIRNEMYLNLTYDASSRPKRGDMEIQGVALSFERPTPPPIWTSRSGANHGA